MRRPLTFFVAAMFAFALLTSVSHTNAPSVSAATIAATTTCNNAVGNGGATCDVTIANTITPTGGSATVTVIECTGSAGVPATACATTSNVLAEPVTAVNQCNGSVNGGGGQLLCSVNVTNTFVGVASAPTAVTVNQCVGSGASGAIGTTIVCLPFPANTSGATITQCNGTGNGGTLVLLSCSATGTESTGLPITINQCNGSNNGGGTRTVCSASITNNAVVVTPSPVPSAPAAPTAGPTAAPTVAAPTAGPTAATPTAPATSVLDDATATNAASPILVLGLTFLVVLSGLMAFRRFGSRTKH